MAIFNISDSYTLKEKREIPEMRTIALLYVHKRTKAEVLILENDDENKTFGIMFKTLPYNSTGVAHIIEHSVLCGSQKYPVKDPLVELVKTSVQTFINALTSADKTYYPVASQNEQDLYNLVDVYLDSVFQPLLTESTFKQEAWHLELDTPEAELKYKGVVFNEMKGAYSNTDRTTLVKTFNSIFPDNVYGFDYGGDPEEIPQLTYDEFKKFYETYYHPSNAKIYFYGNGDTARHLEKVDSYLAKYDEKHIDTSIPDQQPFASPREYQYTYPVTDDTANKHISVVGWGLQEYESFADIYGLDILEYILIGSEASPLKKALLESGLGDDITGVGFYPYLKQHVFSVGLKGAQQGSHQKIIDLILETLNELSKGLDHDLIESAINKAEFFYREGDSGSYPKGIFTMQRAFINWNHGKNPIDVLEFDRAIKRIRAKVDQGEQYFESLIQRHMINNSFRADIHLQPDTTIIEKKSNSEKAKLQAMLEKLNESDKQALVEETVQLKQEQEVKEPEENRKKMPKLHLSDINRSARKIPSLVVREKENLVILSHDLETNGIAYVNFGFSLENFPERLLPYLPVIVGNLFKLGTKSKTYEALALEIDRYTGGLTSSLYANNAYFNRDTLIFKVFVDGKVLFENIGRLLSLVKEVVHDIDFDQKQRLSQLLKEEKAQLESEILSSGASYAMTRSCAYFSDAAKIGEITEGIEHYLFIKELIETIDSDWDSVLDALRETYTTMFSGQQVLVNLTCPQDNNEQFITAFDQIFEIPKSNTLHGQLKNISLDFSNEAFVIPNSVNEMSQTFQMTKSSSELPGCYTLVMKQLYTDYLWTNVRVLGGAYGGSGSYGIYSGLMSFASWRDPNIAKTFATFNGAADYLKNIEIDADELEGVIIGATGSLDKYLSPSQKGWLSLEWYMTGLSDEERQRLRDELLRTTVEDIRNFGNLLAPKSPRIQTIVGNKEAIEIANRESQNKYKIINLL